MKLATHLVALQKRGWLALIPIFVDRVSVELHELPPAVLCGERVSRPIGMRDCIGEHAAFRENWREFG
jgi:hypothetical protein